MKFPVLFSSILVATSFIASSAMANTPTAAQKEQAAKLEQALKSSNIKQSLITICSDTYTKAGALKSLSQADINKLCKCNVESEGRMTVSQQWELQSARNAKDQKKFNEVAQRLAKAEQPKVKACVGTALEAKLAKLQSK
jgi:hypothetical protein